LKAESKAGDSLKKLLKRPAEKCDNSSWSMWGEKRKDGWCEGKELNIAIDELDEEAKGDDNDDGNDDDDNNAGWVGAAETTVGG
jgi:hypothetical protein